ncbi:MAG: hypothetical protein IPK98_16165 [Chloracidobacterium sp.]|nr:hypothetical protein [Chloracidobacterium sp.]
MVVGDKGTILRTADGGVTWEKIKINVRENLYAVSFFDDKNGFAVGSGGITLRTSDGGVTWADQESPLKLNLFAVQVFGVDKAIAAGELGTILITEDGGKTWSTQPNITGKLLQTIVYRGGDKLWVAGRGGTMLKRSLPLTPSLFSLPKGPPVLTTSPRAKPTFRLPIVPITDDGDIPSAVPIKKPN